MVVEKRGKAKNPSAVAQLKSSLVFSEGTFSNVLFKLTLKKVRLNAR